MNSERIHREDDADDTVGAAFAELYDELRQLARAKLRRHRRSALLDTTVLLHESFIKLVGARAGNTFERQRLFAYAARVMRSVIVDYARAGLAQRRGGDCTHVTLDDVVATQLQAPEADVLRVHEALEVLAEADARLARVVELRYFVGLTEAETASVLGVSDRTVRREWEKARLLLSVALA